MSLKGQNDLRDHSLQVRSNKISDKQENIEEKVHQMRSSNGTCNAKFCQEDLSRIGSSGHGKVASSMDKWMGSSIYW